MSNRRLDACLLVSVLILALATSGCANFPPRRATELPPPTDTALPVVVEPTSTPTPLPPPPTDTPTPVVVAAVSTPTPTLESTTEPEPTDTPQAPATATATSPPPSPTPIPEPTELLANGGFEEGFGEDGVAVGWHKFSNGNAAFGWHDDTWELVVWEGEHSQLLSLIDPSLNDRYMGIYQTVDVVSGNAYELTLHGLVRANTPPEQYGHRLYWAVDYDGGTDWQAVEQWEELPWDEQPRVAKSFTIHDYSTVITPTGQSLTLFVRGHSKWQRYSEANFNLDGLSLRGVPGVAPGEPGMPVTGRREVDWVPIVALIFLVLILVREAWRGVSRPGEEV
jgi:hypothetical protein